MRSGQGVDAVRMDISVARFFIFVLLVFCPAHGYGQSLNVVELHGSQSLLPIISVYEDRSKTLDIRQITSERSFKEFHQLDRSAAYKGFTRSVWWGRFTLQNPSNKPVERIIEIGYPAMDQVEFFRPSALSQSDDERYDRQVTGDSVVGRQVDIRSIHALYRVVVPALSEQTYYIRLSGDSTITFDISIHEPMGFIDQEAVRFDSSALFFGIMIAAIIYSLSIYAVMRDEAYLLFALFLIGATTYQASMWGYLTFYLLPETSWLVNLCTITSLSLLVITLVQFSSYFLELKQKSVLMYRAGIVLQAAAAVFIFVSLIDYHTAIFLLMATAAIGVVAALIASVELWRKGIVYGKIFTLCLAAYAAFHAAYSLERIGVIELKDTLDGVFKIGFSIIALLFILVFADRFRRTTYQNEVDLKAARDDAITASRTKSKFLATMSHELRTPLNAVIGFSDIIASETLGPIGHPKYKEYARDIKESGAHLLYIINDLLEISRIEAERIVLDEQQIVVSDLLRRCTRIVDGRAQQNSITIHRADVPKVPYLTGDETRLQQVIINLLFNAVKFTPPGGHIYISATISPAGEYEITIRDTGIGIAPEDQQKILEPFIQIAPHLTRHHGGVGLGLAIAKSIVDLHGGKMRIDSDLGKGTTFVLSFPKDRVVK